MVQLMWRFLCLAVILSGCLAPPGAQVMRSAVTGLSGAVSDVSYVSDHPHHVVLARTMIVSGAGPPIYAIRLGRTYDGVHPGLRLTFAWAGGRELPYRAARRATAFCIGRDCSAREIGKLYVTPDAFEALARSGLSARLLGPDGAIDVRIPPDLFAQSLRLAAAQQLD
jgi:hypothetical protein